MKEMVVYFDLTDLEKLQDVHAFINNWQYARYESCHKCEFGKISDQNITIRFYAHHTRLNPECINQDVINGADKEKKQIETRSTPLSGEIDPSCNICGHFLELDGSCVMCPHIDGTCGCCKPIHKII